MSPPPCISQKSPSLSKNVACSVAAEDEFQLPDSYNKHSFPQIWRLLHHEDPAWPQSGLPEHELLRPRKLLAAGELHGPRQPAAVAGAHPAGQRGQG